MNQYRKEKSNCPNLRFPEFKGEWFSEELGKLCDEFQSGKGLKSEEISEIGSYPVFGGNGLRGFASKYNYDGEYVLIGRQGALCGNVRIINGKNYMTEHAIVVHANEKNNTKFLLYLLDKMNLGQYSDQSAQPGLAVNKLLKIDVKVPNLPEQEKISVFFSLLDQRIEAQSKIIEKYESLIKGLNESLLARNVKFKNCDGQEFTKWQTRSLGEIGGIFNGLSGKTKEDFGRGKPYIQYKQIFDSPKIQIQDCGLVDISKKENQNSVKFGDVFFTISSETPDEIGMSSVLLNGVEEMYLNSFCFGYRVFSLATLNPLFASYLFRSSVFRNEIIKLAQGSTRYNMSKIELMKLIISFPCIEEQTKIAGFLSSIDDKIETERNTLTRYENQKKYFLQNLFI